MSLQTHMPLFIVLSLAAAPGCTGDPYPPRVAVSGTVTLDGEPLTTGALLLIPTESTPGPKSGAAIVDGEFYIPQDQGPSAGRFQVHISTTQSPSDLEHPPNEGPAPTIPAHYNHDSTLFIETTLDGENQFTLELSSETNPF